MTDPAVHPLAQVAELDEERRRYEHWLAQLDARRESSPEHVYARVRADYQGRLQAVLARLAEHAETLRHAVDQLSRRVADMRAGEQQRLDERAEAELRTVVGEYTPEQWAEIQAVSDEELAAIAQDRGAAEHELMQLQDMLARAGAAVTPQAAPEPMPQPAAPATAEVGAAGAAPDRRTPTPASGAPLVLQPGQKVSLDQIPLVAAGDDDLPSPSAPIAQSASSTPLATPRRGTESVAPAAEAAPWPGALEDRSSPGLGRSPTPSDPAYALGEDVGPQIKTLKCQECGTMNYPTEWYCERCGGELATL